MTYSNFITAIWNKDHWRVDGMFCGDKQQMGDRARVWAKCAKGITGHGPRTLVLEVEDSVEAMSLYRTRIITEREAELMGGECVA